MDSPERLPGRAGDLLGRCVELLGEGRIVEAEQRTREAVELSPEDGRLWQLRGLVLLRSQELQGACDALETASLFVPLDWSARCALGDCYRRLGKSALAIDVYRHLASQPSCPTTLLPAVAAGLGSLGAFEDALEVCRTIVTRDPSAHGGYFGVAYYLRRLGEPVESVLPLLKQAHQLAPRVDLYRVTLGTALDQLGFREEAYELLRELDPASIRCRSCLRRMMEIFRCVGDESRSRECQSRVRNLEEPGPDAGTLD